MDEQELVDKVVERVLLIIPDVIGNLMMNQAVVNKLNSEFYSQHKEFADNKQLVASVIEEIEGNNPSLKYEEILEKSVPKIKERLKQVEGLSTTEVSSSINRDMKHMDFLDDNSSNNGVI